MNLPKRNPLNTNIQLHYQHTFNHYPVQVNKGPLAESYLQSMENTFHHALSTHPRTLGIRLDLHLPDDIEFIQTASTSNGFIQKFIASLKAKIKHDREMTAKEHGYAHPCEVRFVWAREVGGCLKPHYHVVLLLNADAYCTLGLFELNRQNMFNRIVQAWASALGLSAPDTQTLVHFPHSATYRLSHQDHEGLKKFFLRCSYLCKVATKQYHDGLHAFGYSRG